MGAVGGVSLGIAPKLRAGAAPKLRAVRLLAFWLLGLVSGVAGAALPASAKPPLVGLISMGRGGFGPRNENARFDAIPSSALDDVIAKRNAFDGVVVNIPWARLQPESDQDFVTAPIDDALAAIRRYNADPATRVKLRAVLRVWPGPNAPDWAKRLGGPPVTVFSAHPRSRGEPFTLGRFWTAEYGAAFRRLQSLLARRYDSEPLIAQVTDSSCASSDDELNAIPKYFDRDAGISSVANLKAAGYTDQALIRCIVDSFEDYAPWRGTDIQLALGPILRTDGDDFRPLRKDAEAGLAIYRQFRDRFGARAVLANHNLSYPVMPLTRDIYPGLARFGGQIEFQTRSPRDLDWHRTIEEGVCLGGRAVELWNSTDVGGYVDIPTATLIAWSDELKRGGRNELCP